MVLAVFAPDRYRPLGPRAGLTGLPHSLYATPRGQDKARVVPDTAGIHQTSFCPFGPVLADQPYGWGMILPNLGRPPDVPYILGKLNSDCFRTIRLQFEVTLDMTGLMSFVREGVPSYALLLMTGENTK